MKVYIYQISGVRQIRPLHLLRQILDTFVQQKQWPMIQPFANLGIVTVNVDANDVLSELCERTGFACDSPGREYSQ